MSEDNDEKFAEVEYAYKVNGEEPVTGSVVVQELDPEQVEDAIRARDKFLQSSGGRVNKVENYLGVIEGFLDEGDIESAARQLEQAEEELSSSSVRKIKDGLGEDRVEELEEETY